MNKRNRIFIGCMITLFTLWSYGQNSKTSKPNFVFIAVDDLNIYNSVLGNFPGNFLEKVYPNSTVRKSVVNRLTPNLSRLAEMGVTFDKAYSAAPLCGPSRTALLTGIPSHISGYYKHDQHFRGYQTLTDAVTLPQYLKDNGYFTSGIGKVFHKGRSYLDRGVFSDWPDQIYSWDKWVEVNSGTGSGSDFDMTQPEELSKYWENPNKKSENFTRFGITNVPIKQSNDYLNAKHISDLILKGKSQITDVFGKTQLVEVPNNKPYFLACGLFAPHLPWVSPKEFIEKFPLDEMQINKELIAWVKKDLEDLSASGKKVTSQTHFDELLEYGKKLDGENGDINAWKAYLQAYLAVIAYSDYNIGVLVDAIEKNPRKDNTIVVLWSDHGYHVGDKNRTGKTTLWEAANHCNLIILDPTRKESSSGKIAKSPVSLQDLYPTIVSLAGLERPKNVYGTDLSPILYDVKANRGTPVLSTHEEGNHTLRTDQYRFLRFKNGDTELYDMIKDPFELKNLANVSKFSKVIADFNRELDVILNQPPSK
ncbi:sulfatase [Flavobacterium sp. ARAG 55.4]|uniref:sulfatase n=1 Tax=Flavobacterium sp. ARAG 55.4 TaxID=3451357 RepID=UPI003F46606C